MVTSHANTKLPYQGTGVRDKQLYTETLDRNGERAVSPFVVHIPLLCCHLNSIANLVAIICKLKTCIDKRCNTNHTVYSGHWFKGMGTPLESTKLVWVDPQVILPSHLQAIPSGIHTVNATIAFQLLIPTHFAMYNFYLLSHFRSTVLLKTTFRNHKT